MMGLPDLRVCCGFRIKLLRNDFENCKSLNMNYSNLLSPYLSLFLSFPLSHFGCVYSCIY